MSGDNDNVKNQVQSYLKTTSAHGLPRIAASETLFSKLCWTALFGTCVVAFLFQAYLIYDKYTRHDKIVSVKLKYEALEFPAVTFCNLNPFKYSLVKDIGKFKQVISTYEEAKNKEMQKPKQRSKRSTHGNQTYTEVFPIPELTVFHPVNSNGNNCESNMYGSVSYPGMDRKRRHCICVHNRLTNQLAPCYDKKFWRKKACSSCHPTMGTCTFAHAQANNMRTSCMCNTIDNVCIVQDNARIHKRRSVKLSHVRASPGMMVRNKQGIRATLTECTCNKHNDKCSARTGFTSAERVHCLCFYDTTEAFSELWRVMGPCFALEEWKSKSCNECTEDGLCNYRTRAYAGAGKHACLCNDKIAMCINDTAETSAGYIITNVHAWLEKQVGLETQTEFIPTPVTPSKVSPTQTFTSGIKVTKIPGETDEEVKTRILLKDRPTDRSSVAQKDLQFAALELTEELRTSMSYKMKEFVRKCSFSRKQCHEKEDFQLFIDPAYGNCYTFRSKNKTSSQSGPIYGLRVELFLNTSSYLPSTESSGAQVVIHARNEYPFPATRGYNAPPGFISSFGLYLRTMERFGPPYGDCISKKPSNYIFRNFSYSVEGCYRSCFQAHIVNSCGCSDPRMPSLPGTAPCNVTEKTCVEESMANFGSGQSRSSINKDCGCKHPCKQQLYSVTYTAAKWPVLPGQTECENNESPAQCMKYYRSEGLMVEVFFQELNYQHLVEVLAYGFSSLLSDFGGQLGFWLGISVITICELLVLIARIMTFGYKNVRIRLWRF